MDTIKELRLNNPEIQKVADNIKSAISELHPGAKSLELVGYQFHFLIDNMLASMGRFSEGFRLSDYE